jgi:hypothetical protein
MGWCRFYRRQPKKFNKFSENEVTGLKGFCMHYRVESHNLSKITHFGEN